MNIRPIARHDDAAVARIIRGVMPEFGAGGAGFAIHDPEVDTMYAAYSVPRASYFVVDDADAIVAGAGVAQLVGGSPEVCELRKMYMLPAARGRGLGRKLLDLCLHTAKAHDYTQCYIETLATMTDAMRLYEENGFTRLATPMGATGHFGCDRWYLRPL